MKKDQAREWMILISLFKATVEQQSMLIGVEKQRSKLLFNQWLKQGDLMLRKFDGVFNEEILEEFTRGIEEAVKKLKSEIDVIE